MGIKLGKAEVQDRACHAKIGQRSCGRLRREMGTSKPKLSETLGL